MRRPLVYIVPTDTWYIERMVWGIAGIDVLLSVALAWFHHPLWALSIIAVGLSSMWVGINGFCIVGNALRLLGARPRLAAPGWTPDQWYFMRTDGWYLERFIYVVVGFNLSLAAVLAMVHSPWWLAFHAFVGVAMLAFSKTGFCIMANGLYWLGAEPRLAPLQRPRRLTGTQAAK